MSGDHVEVIEERPTDRWVGLSGAALAAAVVGVLSRSPGLLLVAGLGVALVAYARVATPGSVSLAVERSFDPAEPGVGEPVTVELVVENVGDRTMPDLRIADGVPDGIRVADGDARLATALAPGAVTSLEYEIAGGRGRCSFDPVTVVVRDVAGVVERRARVSTRGGDVRWPASGGEALLPVAPRLLGPVGRVPAADGGEGLAFHAVREHRPGDPLRRVDWHRRARTGEFATVEFQRERTATVVLVVDARRAAALAPEPGAVSAVERATAAASALLHGFTEAGHAVGLAALGESACWIPPSRGKDHVRRLRGRLADGEGFAPSPVSDPVEGPDGSDADPDDVGDHLLERLPVDASVVAVSPLCDRAGERFVRLLAARECHVSVLSPDPTATGSTGRDLVRLERLARLRELRSAGVAVHDWPAGESLERVLARAEVAP